jgi:hypothetical protein
VRYPPFDYLNHVSRYKCGECGYDYRDKWWAHQVHYEWHMAGLDDGWDRGLSFMIASSHD